MRSFIWPFIGTFIIGCAEIPGVVKSPNTGIGAISGAAITKGIQNIKKELEPKLKLTSYPIEICARTDVDVISCNLIPCKVACTIRYNLEDFLSRKTFSTIELTIKQIESLTIYCVKNKDTCVNAVAKYEGDTLVVKEK